MASFPFVLAISTEDAATLRKFVAENGVPFPVFSDAGAKVEENAYREVGVPVSFIYDRSGAIVAQALSFPTMQRLLEEARASGFAMNSGPVVVA